jgi:hypothetical protein
MRNLVTLSCAIGLTGLAAHAHADPSQPTWCKGLRSSGDVLSRALTDEDPDRGIPAIVEFLCFPDGDAKPKLPQLEARRQYWMKRMAMTEADWATDVPQWAGTSYSIRNTAHVDPQDGVAWSSAGPVEQFALLSMKNGDSKAFALQAGAKPYMADAFQLTQAGRIALIADCIHTNSDNEVHPARWATCQPDIDALDVTKLAIELRADSARTPYDRMVVRTAWVNLQPTLVAHAAKIKALLAKDEIYGKLFEIARKTHAEWAAGGVASKDLLALVSTLDDARMTGSQKALAGCSERAWPAFAAQLAKLTINDLAAEGDPMMNIVAATTRTPDGYLAANALAACEGERDTLTRHLAGAIGGFPGYRGPHTATSTKLAIANLQPDRRGDKVEYGGGGIGVAVGSLKNPGGGSAFAAVAAVADEGDAVRVEFVKTHEMSTYCEFWKPTNKVIKIEADGTVRYHSECGSYVTADADTTPKPVKIAKRYAAGIAKGSKVVVSDGVAIATWKSAKDKLPSFVVGIALK